MENSSAEPIQGKKIICSKNEESTSNVKPVPKQDTGTAEDANPSGEVNMEASIASEDVIRAGGFGATDGLSSILPIASDATDFEETLLDARDYEEPQSLGEKRRPGLGWTDAPGTN